MDASAGIGKILDVLKLSATPATAVAFASGLLVLGGESLLATLGLTDFMASARAWVGLAFVLSITLLFAFGAAAVGRWIKKRWTWAASARNLRARLGRLAADEKDVLSRFLLERRKCLSFDTKDGVSQGLAHADILFRSSSVGDMSGWDFSIQPWAWEYLNEHPELVIGNAAKLKLLAERAAIAHSEGFEEGRAPWNEGDHGMPRSLWHHDRDERRWRRPM